VEKEEVVEIMAGRTGLLDQLCSEWADDQRMSVLFAPLRAKELNPESWNSKVNFWSNLVIKWAQQTNTAVVSMDLLEKAFERDGKSPYCLEDVLRELWACGGIVDFSRYLSSQTPRPTWSSWLKGIGTNALHTVGETVAGFRPNDDMVVPEVASRLANSALMQLRSLPPILRLHKATFLTETQVREVLSPTGFVMDFLVAKKVVSSMLVDGRTVYKVATSDNNGGEAADFEEADAGIIRLHITIQHLNVEIEALEREVKNLDLKVKEELRGGGSRLVAKNHLRRRKAAEVRLNNKFAQLHNLENVMESVVSAEGSKAVVEAYKGGLEALKAIAGKSPSVEEVEGLVEEVGEAVERGEGLSRALVAGGDEENLDDLEMELEMLTKDMMLGGDERRAPRTACTTNESEVVEDQRDGGIEKRMAEEQALLAQLESLSVHDSTLSPALVNTGNRTLGRKEAGSPVAL